MPAIADASIAPTPALTDAHPRRSRQREAAPAPCCAACVALLDACGPALWPLYSRKLLIEGWAGKVSPVEAAYRRAHGSARMRAQPLAFAVAQCRPASSRRDVSNERGVPGIIRQSPG